MVLHLLSHFPLFFLLLLPLSHCQSNLNLSPEMCAPENSSFHQYCSCTKATGRTCGGGITVEFTCFRLPEMYVDQENYPQIDCLIINEATFRELRADHMAQFPNLRGLVIENSALDHILPGALDDLQQLQYLNLVNNRLTMFPRMSLPLLNQIIISHNYIETFDIDTFSRLPALNILNVNYNRIYALREAIWSKNCLLSRLELKGNPLEEISDDVFTGTHVQILDLSETRIKRMPTPLQLRERLKTLWLNRVFNLKTFRILMPQDTSYSNQTFPFLQEVTFPYHAHCCQLQQLNYMYRGLRRITKRGAWRVEHASEKGVKLTLKELDDEEDVKIHSKQEVKLVRQVRQVYEDANVTVCFNLTSLRCVDPTSSLDLTTVSLLYNSTEFCSAFDACTSTCLQAICPEVCATPTISESGDGMIPPLSDNGTVYCLVQGSDDSSRTITPTNSYVLVPQSSQNSIPLSSSHYVIPSIAAPLPTSSVPSTSSFSISPSPSILSPSPLPSPSLSPSPLSPSPSPSNPLTTFKTTVNRTLCPSSSPLVTPSLTTPLFSCRVSVVTASCTGIIDGPTSSPAPVTTENPCPDNLIDLCPPPFSFPFSCMMCVNSFCQDPVSCMSDFPEICKCFINRKRRSVDIEHDRLHHEGESHPDIGSDSRSSDQSEGIVGNSRMEGARRRKRESANFNDDIFEISLDNYSQPLTCQIISPSQTTTTQQTPTTFPECVPPDVIPINSTVPINLTSCRPLEDPFNPCEDLLGKSDYLRVAIWFVIIIAFCGNGLVFVIFIGYSVILRRTKQDLFVIHFLYFNLAIADFLMAVYLFIIAVVDISTKNEFYLTDIAWRTGGFCGFAGFCAITSTAMSVYVLVVITIERTYTIVRVLARKKLNKKRALMVMLIGWFFAMVLATLPLVGVSDYSSVAICLPFNVEGDEDKAYVLFLLLSTGIAFISIAVCYTIIFQQIFCRSKKRSPFQESKKRLIGEIKVAIRIFFLVLTNFICWFPIALVGIAAIFDRSFVKDLNFARWAMVFIFPVNACVNPLLYSLTTRAFRENFILLTNQCGFFNKTAQQIKNVRIGMTPSTNNKTTDDTSAVPPRGGGATTVYQRIRSFSLISHWSSTDLLGRANRRSLTMSQTSFDSNHNMIFINSRRRNSNMSSESEESANTGGDNTIGNLGFRSASPDGTKSGMTDHLRVKTKISTSSLGAVPEEAEIPMELIADQNAIKVNPAFSDERSEDKRKEEEEELREFYQNNLADEIEFGDEVIELEGMGESSSNSKLNMDEEKQSYNKGDSDIDSGICQESNVSLSLPS